MQKFICFILLIVGSTFSFAQSALVDVKLSPAGSFQAKTNEVKGFAVKKADTFEAQNIVVNLTSLKTGIDLRDEHTKKHLETEQFPEAVLLSAKGQNGKGEGVIKIKGIEKKIEGTYEVSGGKLTAHFPLKIADFNITKVKYMGVGVKEEIELTVVVPIQ